MHERHIKRASAIVSATDLLPDLGAIVNGYLISVSYLDKMADLVTMQPGNEFSFVAMSSDFLFSWIVHGDDPRDYEYRLVIANRAWPGNRIAARDSFTLNRIVAIAGLMSMPVAGSSWTMGDYSFDSFTSSLYAILNGI